MSRGWDGSLISFSPVLKALAWDAGVLGSVPHLLAVEKLFELESPTLQESTLTTGLNLSY